MRASLGRAVDEEVGRGVDDESEMAKADQTFEPEGALPFLAHRVACDHLVKEEELEKVGDKAGQVAQQEGHHNQVEDEEQLFVAH